MNLRRESASHGSACTFLAHDSEHLHRILLIDRIGHTGEVQLQVDSSIQHDGKTREGSAYTRDMST